MTHTCYVFSPFVFQAVVMVLESKGDTASLMIIKLLQSFWKTGLITVDQMNRVSPLKTLKPAISLTNDVLVKINA